MMPRTWIAGLLALALPTVSHGQARPNAVRVPGLTAYSLQDLDLPPHRPGEPAVLAVDVEGVPYVLDLQPHSLRSPDFRVILIEGTGRRTVEPPPVSTYRGAVYGPDGGLVAGARALGSESEEGWSLTLDIPGHRRVQVRPASELVEGTAPSSLHVAYEEDAVVQEEEFTCGVEESGSAFLGESEPGDVTARPDGSTPGVAAAVTGSQIVEIAFDCDAEYFVLNGLNEVSTVRDIERVMNIVERLYETNVQITYEITSIVIRSLPTTSDPYTTGVPGDLLMQVLDEWDDGFPSIRRDVVHLMTGRDLDQSTIGVAYRGVVCNRANGYGLSQTRFAQDLRIRAALTAHELGHNWNSLHCNGNGDCHVMCAVIGGCMGTGNPLEFGAPVINVISSFRNSRACLQAEPDYLAAPFSEDGTAPNDLDPDKWVFNDGASTSDLAGGEPSPGGSILLNSGGTEEGLTDDLRTHFIDLRGRSGLSLSFFAKHVGTEAGEDLIVEFRNDADASWNPLTSLPSDGVDQTDFVFHQRPLPGTSYHERFRVRFRPASDELDDQWFVDNVLIHDGPNLAQTPVVRGAVLGHEAHGLTPGDNVLFLLSFLNGGPVGSGVGPSYFGGNLVLDIAPPYCNLGFAVADANGVARKMILVPMAVPPGTPTWTQVIRIDANPAMSTTSNVVAQRVQ